MKKTKEKRALMGEALGGVFRENGGEGENALKKKVLKCSECWSVRQKWGRNAFQSLIYSDEVGQTHSRLE